MARSLVPADSTPLAAAVVAQNHPMWVDLQNGEMPWAPGELPQLDEHQLAVR